MGRVNGTRFVNRFPNRFKFVHVNIVCSLPLAKNALNSLTSNFILVTEYIVIHQCIQQ